MRRELLGVVSRPGTSALCGGPAIYTRVGPYLSWIQSTINQRIRGNYRLDWNGNGSTGGTIELRCLATGEVRKASTSVRGVEVALDCPPSSQVTAICKLVDPETSIVQFDRRINNGPWTAVGGTSPTQRASSWLTGATGSATSKAVVDYHCNISD